jgi:hypothetical protein
MCEGEEQRNETRGHQCKDQVTRPTVGAELTIFHQERLADFLYSYWRIFPVPGAALAASTDS